MKKGSSCIADKFDIIIKLIRNGVQITDIAKIVGCSRNTIYVILKNNEITPKNERFDHYFFDVIDSEEKAYWLGFLYADGSLSDRLHRITLGLKKSDIKHLIKYHASLKSTMKISICADRVASNHHSKQMFTSLCKHGCTPRKSYTLT